MFDLNRLELLLLLLLFSVRCRLVIFVVPLGRVTAPSGVGRWLFHGVCFLGNFLLARCFLFPFCGEGMTAGHRVVCASSPQGQMTFQCQSFSCVTKGVRPPLLEPTYRGECNESTCTSVLTHRLGTP